MNIRIKVGDDPSFAMVQTPEDIETVIEQLEKDGFEPSDISVITGDVTSFNLERVKQTHAQMLYLLTDSSTVEERDTWPRQQLWSEKYIANDKKYEHLLKILTLENESVSELSQSIVGKSQAVDLLIATAGNMKRSTNDALENSSDWKDQKQIMITAKIKAEEAKLAYLKSIGKL